MKNKKLLFRVVALFSALLMLVNVSFANVSAENTGDIELTPLTFSDFGFQDGNIEGTFGGEATGKTMKNIIFNGTVTFHGALCRYLLFNGWAGLRFDFNTDYIRVIANGGAKGDWWIYKESLGMSSLQDVTFRFGFSLETVNETDAGLKVYYEGTEVLSQTLVGAYGDSGYLNAATLTFSDATAVHPITIASYKEGADTTTMTEMTFSSFGFADGNIDTTIGKKAVGKTLENIVFKGDVTFHGAKLRYMLFNGWTGLRFDFDTDYIRVIANGGAKGDWWIYKESLGLTSLQDVTFELKVSLEKVNTTDAHLKVYYDGTEVLNQTLAGAYGTSGYLNTATLTFDSATAEYPITIASYVEPGDEEEEEQETIFTPSEDLKDITLTNFGIGSTSVTGTLSASYEGVTLDGTRLTMNITIPNNPSEMSYIRFGGLGEGWEGIGIRCSGDGSLVMQDWKNAGEIKETFTSDVTGFDLLDTPIKLSLTTEFIDADGDETEDDVMVGVYFNDELYNDRAIIFMNRTADFGKAILLYTDNTQYPIVLEVEEAEQPELATVTLQEMGISNAKYAYDNDQLVVSGTYASSLLNTVLTQKVTLSAHADNWINYAGSNSPWLGIRFKTLEDGSIFFAAADGEFSESGVLLPEIAGTDFVGTEIELAIELIESGDNVKLGIYFNGIRYNNQYFTLTGAASKLGGHIGFYVKDAEGSITIGTPEAAPTVDESFSELTFNSYDIESGTYGYNDGQLAVSGKIKADSMDKIVFTDTVNFSDTGVQLRIGGTDSPWKGIVLQSIGDGKLHMTPAEGGFTPITFDSVKAGVQLTDRNMELTLSFEYVDSDGDGAKDDVKLGVWFDGKAYNDRWIYLKDYAESLGGYLGIYCSDKDASFQLWTYMPAIDFAEYGFTTRWAYTLGLIQ